MPDEIEKAIYSISTKAYLSQEAKEMVKRGKTQLKQDGVYGINPIDPEFVPATVDRRTVLGMMFFPDIIEIQLLVVGFFFNLLILAPLLQFNLSSPSFVIFFGFVSLSLFAYRWGQSMSKFLIYSF